MALASLGFTGGPSITFRINPNSVDWGFDIHTAVIDTVGGRVIQITGATLRDLTVVGDLGEDRKAGPSPDSLKDHAGVSWRMHEAFIRQCRSIMERQSSDSSTPGLMHEPAVFNYPARGWRWHVYLKAVDDADGSNSIEHRTGKYSHGYKLTMFIVQSTSDDLVKAGSSGSNISDAQSKAIASYIERISAGIGWKQSEYNGGMADATPSGNNKGKTP